MTEIIKATGLAGDKDYALQVRPVFNDGSTGDWGPTFSIIRRVLTGSATGLTLSSSSVGLRVTWSGALDPAYEEQWLIKKSDTQFTETNFDTTGTEVYRGFLSTFADIDLKQETYVSIGVCKIDKFGNRSAISEINKTFPIPSALSGVSTENVAGGFSVNFITPTVTDANHFVVLRGKYGAPFFSYTVTNKQKAAYTCTLTTSTTPPIAGEVVQISIGDSKFDGIYTVASSAGSSFTYIHSISETVTSTATTGYIIPTSTGPNEEGFEIFRYDIVEAGQSVSVPYSPDTAGAKLYMAIGIEDSYKNRTLWSLGDGSGSPLVYGRNFIGKRDGVTIVTTANKSDNQHWKYGYIGWSNAHSSTTKALNSTSVAAPIIQPVDTASAIEIGINNGSSAMDFGSQSRTYPSIVNNGSGYSIDNISGPIVDDSFVAMSTHDQNIGAAWTSLFPDDDVAQVWVECSASDIIDDSLTPAGTWPIALDGSRSVAGSFTITPTAWGGSTDDATADLKLFAVIGDWSAQRAGTVYDPHYHPIDAYDGTWGRSAIKSHTVNNKSKSGYICTLTLDTTAFGSTRGVYPEVGESITVMIGDSAFDGTAIVRTRSSNVITYEHHTTGTMAGTSTTGTVTTNISTSWTVTNKEANTTSIILTITPTTSMPSIGDYVDVAIGDSRYKTANNENGGRVTGVSSTTITVELAGSIGSSTAISGSDKRVVSRSSGAKSYTQLIQTWNISKDPDFGMFNGSGVGIPFTANWNWSAPENFSPNQVRFVWVIEYSDNRFLTARAGGNSMVAGTKYAIKLSNFNAWPGVNIYANTGSTNQFSDAQHFKAQTKFYEDANFDKSVTIEEDLYVNGSNFVAGDMQGSSLDIINDLNILDGDLFVKGDLGINAGTLYVYNDDYPIISSGGSWSGEKTVNSIRATQNFPTTTKSWLAIVTWSGQFNAAAAATVTFRMYRYNSGSGAWIQVRNTAARTNVAGAVGGSLTHISVLDATNNPRIEYMITADPDGVNLSTGYAGSSWPAESNRLQILALPVNRDNMTTKKTTHTGTSPATPYTSVADPNADDAADPPKKTKSATIKFVGGWKKSYKGDGSLNAYTSGDLMQGYYSATNGNQRSAWGLGTTDWQKVSGDNITEADLVDGSVRILSCTMTIKATHWYAYSGGTLVVGTHNDNVASFRSDYGNINGKNTDRKRIAFPGTVTKSFDLGTTIGKELWNGHIMDNLWGGGTTNINIDGEGSAAGIIIGPGPSTSSQFYGAFSPSSLQITMKVQWKES